MKNKYNKRKEAASRSRPPKRRGVKEEKDKEVFKRRKFNKNNHVEPVVKDDENSESASDEEEIEGTGFGKFLQVFGSTQSNAAIDSGDSEEDSGSEEDVGDAKDDEEGDDNGADVEDDTESDVPSGDDSSESEDADIDSGEEDIDSKEEILERLEDSEVICEEVEEDETESSDPFSAHYESDLPPDVVSVLDGDSKVRWRTSTSHFPQLGNLQVQNLNLKSKAGKDSGLSGAPTVGGSSESQRKLEISQGKLVSSLPGLRSDPQQLHLKQKLLNNIPVGGLTDLQTEALSIMGDYKDLLYTDRRSEKGEEWRLAYTLHALNHVLKTRARIVNNNAKHEARDEGEERLRDQGFTRPKVLIVVPFKESCRRVVELMISLLFGDNKGNVANKKRFDKDYVKVETARKDKSDDYYDTFEGDIDDSFKLGVAVTKKTMKLYTDFYSSDIIICSPLGLRLVTGVDGDQEERGMDTDFLSSIEVVVLDQMDVLLMQNWDHVTTMLAQLHKQPKESHGVDFSRVRLWSLDGHSRYYRQTILLSSVTAPELNSVWSGHCSNYTGKVRSANPVTGRGSLARVLSDTPLVWHRVAVTSLKESLDQRFKYFTEKIMPQFNRDCMDHTLVFVPSYYDFVKVRNWFKSSDLDYSEISEYTKEKRIAKARDEFYHNEKHYLLYTERSHFYRRFRLKGVRHLIFYQPPTFGWVMSDMCNLLQTAFQNPRGGSDTNMSITVLYSRYDSAKLGLCLGSSTAASMLSAEKNVHKFSQSGR